MKCCQKSNWGGKREMAGRKKTCLKKVPFNRRINENILNILRDYAKRHNLTDTEALESAILLQSNIEKLKGDMVMKICIPTSEGKLCGHFGHCDSFTFAEINPETKEILTIDDALKEVEKEKEKSLRRSLFPIEIIIVYSFVLITCWVLNGITYIN